MQTDHAPEFHNAYYNAKFELACALLEYALKDPTEDITAKTDGLYRPMSELRGYLCMAHPWIYSDREIELKGYPIQLVMEAIYKKHREAPELRLDRRLYDILLIQLQFSRSGKQVIIALKELAYQLRCEKNHTAPFQLDAKSLLHACALNVQANRSYLENRMSELEDLDDSLRRHHGLGFLS